MARNAPSGDEIDRLIRQAHFYLSQPDADAGQFAMCLSDLRTADWEKRLKGEPRSWERFCRESLRSEAADLQEVIAGAAALHQAGLINPTVAQAREALRFEVNCESGLPNAEESTAVVTPSPMQRLRLDWLRLTALEREEFLTWALAQQGKGPNKP